MSENQALIFCLIILLISIITILYFRNKYSQSPINLPNNKNYLEKIAILEQQIKEFQPIVNSDESEKIVALETSLVQLNEEHQDLEEQVDLLESNLINIRTERDSLLQQVALLEANNEDKKDDNAMLEQELKDKVQSLEHLITSLTQENRLLEERVQEQTKEIQEKDIVFVAPSITEIVPEIKATVLEQKTIKSILIVDDSLVVRNKMKKLLEVNGYDVVTANDGVDALAKIPLKKLSLIITDLEMPNLDGLGLIKKISENPETKHIPIMAITGHEEVKLYISEAESLCGLHKKPWHDENILKKIESLTKVC